MGLDVFSVAMPFLLRVTLGFWRERGYIDEFDVFIVCCTPLRHPLVEVVPRMHRTHTSTTSLSSAILRGLTEVRQLVVRQFEEGDGKVTTWIGRGWIKKLVLETGAGCSEHRKDVL